MNIAWYVPTTSTSRSRNLLIEETPHFVPEFADFNSISSISFMCSSNVMANIFACPFVMSSCVEPPANNRPSSSDVSRHNT